MTGDIMSYAHKEIYYLETKTKSQMSEDLVNLFASPAGRELVKYKPKAKTKYKANPTAMDFFAFKPNLASTAGLACLPGIASPSSPTRGKPTPLKQEGVVAPADPAASPSQPATRSGSKTRRKSIDLYNEAAAILGLTCSQTNDCKCIECQCHYFDYEEDIDYSSESYSESLCSIQ